MSRCSGSDSGLHTFTFTSPSPEEENIIKTYLTCIACGERRAIGIMGDLLVRKDGEWVKLEPGGHGYIKTDKEE